MEFDVRLLLTIGGMLVSVVSAAAIAKQQLKTLSEHIQDIESRLRKLDTRLDKNDNQTDITIQRLGILAGMMDPPTMDRRSRELERLRADLDHLQKKVPD
jgi:hypothetical protein